MTKRIIRTNNKEIYDKLKALNFINTITLETASSKQINKILESINHNGIVLEVKHTYTLTKKNDLNFEIYLGDK